MTKMDYFNKCSCSSGGGNENFLDCAPCPPPLLSYSELKTTAMGKLCQQEVCSIARRCRMAESSMMMTDCVEVQSAFICDLTCIILIPCVLSIVLAILLIAVCKRRKEVTQDTLNVVFNDMDSESSDKSSDKGTINKAMKRAFDAEYPDGLQQPKDPENGGLEASGGIITWNQNGMMYEKDVKVRDIVNGHSPELGNGVRNRAHVDGQDVVTVAKL